MSPSDREGSRAPEGVIENDAARKRAAIEAYARHEAVLRRTARRYSICADDADDALQRGFEILLRKAPSDDPRELIRWTQTVVKHEALAVRRERERILSGPAAREPEPGDEDWVALIPANADGPPERAERREAVARSREALQTLKPQELRALTLLAEGYSYIEIGEITGYSATKINRCLAEGRERFRHFISRSEDGSRCEEMGPLLSSFCDGEASDEDAATLREHLRACPHCRATLRAYRAAPAAAAALAPTIPLGRGLLDRTQEVLAGMASRFGPGGAGGADSGLTQVAAAGGARGAGAAALAKVLAVCVGTVGGAAACVATGVVPVPLVPTQSSALQQESNSDATETTEAQGEAPPVDYEPAPETSTPEPEESRPTDNEGATRSDPVPAASSGAVEYTPPPPSAEAAASSPSAGSESGGGDPSGEFGP